MSEPFTAEWLELREPVDHRSRASSAVTMLLKEWRIKQWSRVVDLGAGNGSNLRYLAPRLPKPQHWTLVDCDASLLANCVLSELDVDVTSVVSDIAETVAMVVEDAHADLVTASAFLDLVSEGWLSTVVDVCRAKRRGAYFSLTYDGSIQWHTGSDDQRFLDDPDDAFIRRTFNMHQRRDKGFGPAAGPMASLKAEADFRAAGYQVWLLQSRWYLGPNDSRLVGMLVDAWESASIEQEPAAARRIHAWAMRRRDAVRRSEFGLSVGHLDLLALPGST